jgi:hypothetical protein
MEEVILRDEMDEYLVLLKSYKDEYAKRAHTGKAQRVRTLISHIAKMANFFKQDVYPGVYLAMVIKNNDISVEDVKYAITYHAAVDPPFTREKVIADRNRIKEFLMNTARTASDLMTTTKVEDMFSKFKTAVSNSERVALIERMELVFNEGNLVDMTNNLEQDEPDN